MALTITYKTSSLFNTSTITGGDTVTCAFGTPLAVGELGVIAISWRGTGTLSTPTGWQKAQSIVGNNGGFSRLDVYVRLATNTINSFAFAAATLTHVCATGRILQKLGSSTWAVATVGGQDLNSDLQFRGVAGSPIIVKVDDVICSFAGADKNFGIGISNFSIGGITSSILSGTTSPFGTSQSGGNIAVAESYQAVTAATTATLSFNWDYTTNSTAGAAAFVLVREVKDPLVIMDPLDTQEIGSSGGYVGGIPSAEAFGNICFQLPVIPCECPDTNEVTLPTLDDSSASSSAVPETGRDILIDPITDNLALTASGDLAIVRGVDSIAQALRQRLRTYLGEWYLNVDAGVPWSTQILGVKNLNLSTVRSLLREQIKDIAGILEITQLDVSLDKQARALSVVVRCTSDLGEFVENLTLGATENV